MRAEAIVELGLRAGRRFIHVEGTLQATVIAAQAFTSLIPFLVVAAAISPGHGDLGEKFVDQFNLKGASAESVEALFNSAGEVKSTVTWVGILILLLSSLSFTRAVQRTFARAYDVQLSPARAAGRGLWWLAFFAVWIATAGSLKETLTDATGPVLAVATGSLVGFGFWLITPILLLGVLDWRRLLPGAIVCGVASGVLGVASQIWIPILLRWSAEKYGLIGIAFALQSWLLAYSFIVVAGAVFGATVTEDRVKPGAAAPA